MVNLKLIFNFYRFLFKVSLVPFPLRPQVSESTTCSKWARWAGNVCRWLVNAVLLCIIRVLFNNFVVLYRQYYYKSRYEYGSHFFICYITFCWLLTFSAMLYLRIVTRKLRFGETLAAILKLHEKYLTGKNNLGISKYFYFSLLLFYPQCLMRGLTCVIYPLLIPQMGVLDISKIFGVQIFYSFFYLLAHSCLFFSILMRVLTEVLRPPFPHRPLTPGAYRKYMLLYEEVRKLAAQVNRMFSPLLLLAYVTSFLGASIIMALGPTPYALSAMEYYDFAVLNVIASVMCLNCVIRCNNQRENYLNLLHVELSKGTDKRLILRQLDFNTRMIESLRKDEEWFNVGCFISVDESILLMVFQTFYDTTLGFKLMTVLMRVLTEVLRPPFPHRPLTPGAYRKYMLLYEEVRKLAAQVNLVFSPLLLPAYVTSVLGASIFMALSTTLYVLSTIHDLGFAMVNVIVSVICLNCVIRCNKQRENCLNLLHFELWKRTNKRLVLCELDFNIRLIERLLREEEWFNVGCFISVDESLLLTVFQMLYDNTLGFQKLSVDNRSIASTNPQTFKQEWKRILHMK